MKLCKLHWKGGEEFLFEFIEALQKDTFPFFKSEVKYSGSKEEDKEKDVLSIETACQMFYYFALSFLSSMDIYKKEDQDDMLSDEFLTNVSNDFGITFTKYTISV